MIKIDSFCVNDSAVYIENEYNLCHYRYNRSAAFYMNYKWPNEFEKKHFKRINKFLKRLLKYEQIR